MAVYPPVLLGWEDPSTHPSRAIPLTSRGGLALAAGVNLAPEPFIPPGGPTGGLASRVASNRPKSKTRSGLVSGDQIRGSRCLDWRSKMLKSQEFSYAGRCPGAKFRGTSLEFGGPKRYAGPLILGVTPIDRRNSRRMGSADLQREYWAANHVLRRRPPTHPAVRAFVASKVEFIRECLEGRMGRRLSELSVLDVGAGNGFFAHYLLEAFGHVTAIDFSELILGAHPASAKVLGDVNSLPFPDRSFDVVLCSNLIHHFFHPQRAMDEMARVADAALVVSDPNRNNPLMFSFGALVPSERGTLKFNQRFLKTLVTSPSPALGRVSTRTQGIMVPNEVPGWAFPFGRTLEPFLFPRMYLPSVAGQVQAASPSE